MQSSRKTLVKEADRWFSKYIRLRDGRCVTCGSQQNLQCGHLFSRKSYSTRWDERNAYAQCAGCNLLHEHDPGPLTSYFLSLYSVEDFNRLHGAYRSPRKFTNADLKHLVEVYKTKVKEIENGNYF